MQGENEGGFDCIKAFSETDFTEDLKKFDVPTSDYAWRRRSDRADRCRRPLSAKIVKNARLKVYPGFPHGMPTTHHEQINNDLLAFLKSSTAAKVA